MPVPSGAKNGEYIGLHYCYYVLCMEGVKLGCLPSLVVTSPDGFPLQAAALQHPCLRGQAVEHSPITLASF